MRRFLTILRYRYVPEHLFGELLSKPWIDNVIPVTVLGIVLIIFGIYTPAFFGPANLSDLSRFLGEYAFIAIGMTIVMLAGGIDLSVGSIFALGNYLSLLLVFKGVHVAIALPLVIAAGGLVGFINGLLIGYLRLRAFLATLVMLIIIRAVVDILLRNSGELVTGIDIEGEWLFNFLADGSVLGIPSSIILAAIVGIGVHILLTRMKLGWHINAVGGSRRSAYSAGIAVRRTVCLTYVFSGALAAFASFFYAARLTAASYETGVGMELIVITAAVLGGISLGGGKGSVMKAVLGMATVLCITNGMLRLGMASGGSSMILGLVLAAAVAFDVRWNKNREKILNKSYVSPTLVEMPPLQETAEGSDSPYAVNTALAAARPIALGKVDGAEDVVLDEDDNIYCGSRHGHVMRFFAPDYTRSEIYAHIGGQPLGMTIDHEGSVVVCVTGMGLYKITKDREVVKLCDQTNRSLLSVVDDSRVRFADDCDIAPDGKIYFSDPTIRYPHSEWLLDALEGRATGRIICHDPKTGTSKTVLTGLVFANGVCLSHDRQSILVAQTWNGKVTRYWIDGPRKGQAEELISDLPGYPDNIRRASDGTYWCALVGMRSPAFDLAMEIPQMRRRMVNRVAPDNWLFPSTNAGCVVKFDDNGKILLSLWDKEGKDHPQVTSLREHKGKLYLAGTNNNRLGILDLPESDKGWTAWQSYWGGSRA